MFTHHLAVIMEALTQSHKTIRLINCVCHIASLCSLFVISADQRLAFVTYYHRLSITAFGKNHFDTSRLLQKTI